MIKFKNLAVSAAIALAAGVAPVAAEINIKVAHESEAEVSFPGTGSVAGLAAMQNFLSAATGGEINLEIFPNNSLGNSRSLLEQAQNGIIQMNRTYTNIMVSFCPEIGVTAIPFLFKNEQIAFHALGGKFGEELSQKFIECTGLRVLAWGDAGYRHVYAQDGFLSTPADYSGVKMRVPENPGLLAIFESLGAKAVTITWAEIYTGLQTGLATAAETELVPMYIKKMYEVVPYVTMTRHVYGNHTLLINEEFFQSLSEEHQNVFMEAAALYTTVTNGFNLASQQATREALIDLGAQFYDPSAEEIAELKALAVEPYLDHLRKTVNQEWIDKAFAAAEEAEAYFANK